MVCSLGICNAKGSAVVVAGADDRNSPYLPWALPFGSSEFPKPLRSDPRYRAFWRASPEITGLLTARRGASKMLS